jgi:hypothetical protein
LTINNNKNLNSIQAPSMNNMLIKSFDKIITYDNKYTNINIESTDINERSNTFAAINIKDNLNTILDNNDLDYNIDDIYNNNWDNFNEMINIEHKIESIENNFNVLNKLYDAQNIYFYNSGDKKSIEINNTLNAETQTSQKRQKFKKTS